MVVRKGVFFSSEKFISCKETPSHVEYRVVYFLGFFGYYSPFVFLCSSVVGYGLFGFIVVAYLVVFVFFAALCGHGRFCYFSRRIHHSPCKNSSSFPVYTDVVSLYLHVLIVYLGVFVKESHFFLNIKTAVFCFAKQYVL